MEQIVIITLSIVGVLAVVTSFIFAFFRRKDHRLSSMRLAVFVAVVTFVAATAAFIPVMRILYGHSWVRAPAAAGIQAVFTSQTYDPQTGLFSLYGSVSGLRPEQELWVVFGSAQRDHLFLASAPCDLLPENRFSCQKIATGAPSPAEPNIKGFMVAAMPEGAAVLRQGSVGSPGAVDVHHLPGGATLISQISVGN